MTEPGPEPRAEPATEPGSEAAAEPGSEAAADPRSALPGLTRLLQRPAVAEAVAGAGHTTVVDALRRVLADARAAVTSGGPVPSPERLVADAVSLVAQRTRRGLRPVVNATGVILHTNLGRAPLSAAAIDAMTAAAGPTDLEIDLATAERGGRGAAANETVAQLIGAEAALMVNNGAAALVLALMALGHGREVVISRGELVEIGGSFRLPDIMEAAGCRLREIGTTNRTHVEDYRRAITDDTAIVLRVHPSNFRMDGFVHRPTTSELAEVARSAGVPFVDDLGSGLLHGDVSAPEEPVAADAVRHGADLVIFSGDKLLGGPQAGILAGRRELVERCRRAPLARALRLDKLRMAAMEATLAAHRRGAADELPVWAMAHADPAEVRARADRLAEACGGEVVACEAVLGGGSAPGGRLASWGVAFPGDAEELAHRLRTGEPAVVVRIAADRVVADLRSVPPSLDDTLREAIVQATSADRWT